MTREYAQIIEAVYAVVSRHSGSDRMRIAGLIMRASVLIIRAESGAKCAAERCYNIADEMAVT